jgi:hypothetical protein
MLLKAAKIEGCFLNIKQNGSNCPKAAVIKIKFLAQIAMNCKAEPKIKL